MIRHVLTIIYTLALALGIGGASAWLITDRSSGLSSLTIGQWTGHPIPPSGTADPYARAGAARTGEVPLGAAEGLIMMATTDTDGEPLLGTCSYLIEGRGPPARLWTLRIAGADREPAEPRPSLPNLAHSRAILRDPGGAFALTLSSEARPGNWLHLSHNGPVSLVLSLYDTTIAANVALVEVSLPSVRKIGCRS